MKRLLWIAILTVLLVACGGGPDFDRAIVGKWEGDTSEDGLYNIDWEFFEDGTVIITSTHVAFDISAPVIATYAFEDEDTITIQAEDSDTGPGRRDIRMPDDNTLILTAPVSGVQSVMSRVQNP